MNQENYIEAMTNGETAFSNDHYDLALEWFQKAIKENPNDTDALTKAGTVCVPLEKFDDSFTYFQKAVEINPENGDFIFNLGNAYFFHGEYGKALELYAEAERKGCSKEAKPKLYYQMALLCSLRQDVKSSLANFKKYEDADPTGMAALNPDAISEKIKLYMMIEDYENAAKCAVQWIAVSPTEMRGYMVYFSILMAQQSYDKAEQVLNDVEKYAELDEDDQLNIQAERVAFLAAKSDVDPEHAEAYLQEAYDLMVNLKKIAPASKQQDFTLTLAEICLKMGRYQEAIETASSLLPKETVSPLPKIESQSDFIEELDEAEIEDMAEADMQAIDEKIAAGELDENIGEVAEVYYDENGNPVREYPEDAFDLPDDEEKSESPLHTEQQTATPIETVTEVSYDRLYFTLLSCYLAMEDYENAYQFGGLLKHSENEYQSYFGRYAEAFSMRKLVGTSPAFSKEMADRKYAEAIAFYRNKMIQSPGNSFAVIFRTRMYAESGKFAKAEEMASLLVLDEKEALMAYINECRKELQKM